MRQTLLLSVLTILLFRCGGGSPAANKDEEKKNAVYGLESGIVEFHYDSSDAKDILYFDHWGNRSALYQYAKMGGDEAELTHITIKTGADNYDIDVTDKTGMKMTNPFGSGGDGMNDVMGFPEERKIGVLGGKQIGTDTVMGKTCNVWDDGMQQMGTKYYFYQGISIKEVTNLDGSLMIKRAVKIDENVKVPDDKFDVPKDIKFN